MEEDWKPFEVRETEEGKTLYLHGTEESRLKVEGDKVAVVGEKEMRRFLIKFLALLIKLVIAVFYLVPFVVVCLIAYLKHRKPGTIQIRTTAFSRLLQKRWKFTKH